MKEVVKTDLAPAPIGPYNQAIKAGNMLFVSGQIAIDPSSGELKLTNLKEETNLVLTNLKNVVEAGGFALNDVVKCSIFISDMNQFSRINSVYSDYFDGEEAPARETVEVACLPKNANVEISCIAVKSKSY